MNNIIENNCKRCKNYDLCQSTGCDIKKKLETLINDSTQKDKAIDECIEYLEKFIPIDEDTILMRERQRDYILEKLKQAKGSDE